MIGAMKTALTFAILFVLSLSVRAGNDCSVFIMPAEGVTADKALEKKLKSKFKARHFAVMTLWSDARFAVTYETSCVNEGPRGCNEAQALIRLHDRVFNHYLNFPGVNFRWFFVDAKESWALNDAAKKLPNCAH